MKRSKKDASSEEDQIESLEYENPGDDKIEEDEDVINHSGIASEKLREDFENLKLEDAGNVVVKLVANPIFQAIEEEKSEDQALQEVWVRDLRQLKQYEVLDFENEAYELLYRISAEWPCLWIYYQEVLTQTASRTQCI